MGVASRRIHMYTSFQSHASYCIRCSLFFEPEEQSVGERTSLCFEFSPSAGTKQGALCKGSLMEDAEDWIIDANGFYIATRSFLLRRGYCCTNQCLNCPSINWRNSPLWKPLVAAMIAQTKGSPRAIEGVQKALVQHEQQVQAARQSERAFHQQMIVYYRLLLKHWQASRE